MWIEIFKDQVSIDLSKVSHVTNFPGESVQMYFIGGNYIYWNDISASKLGFKSQTELYHYLNKIVSKFHVTDGN